MLSHASVANTIRNSCQTGQSTTQPKWRPWRKPSGEQGLEGHEDDLGQDVAAEEDEDHVALGPLEDGGQQQVERQQQAGRARRCDFTNCWVWLNHTLGVATPAR